MSNGLNSTARKRAAPPAQHPSPSKTPRTESIIHIDNTSSASSSTNRLDSPVTICPAPAPIDTQNLATFMFHRLLANIPQQLPSMPPTPSNCSQYEYPPVRLQPLQRLVSF
ncbi:hypothetical protein BDB00DRAFT_791025 [Zychaea mexicana]|uniref:uncharacterized protein n=1 Tax=Zychaea mexicana TaxID=64656 RepID=UPI0022FDBD63|nr:uncharacterized protein BDB00DRAFT_791025 [Zychaea mexicana]KAI9489512.1 hypothetical protein BDB00DRAFT_791025 [Zychaea mexicana]